MKKSNVVKLAIVFVAGFLFSSLPAVAQYGPTLSCNSNDMGRHYCDIGPNDGVRVIRQHSQAACIAGRTYGVQGPRMWVDRGCRADFQVIPDRRGGRDDRWDHGRRDDHGYGYRDHDDLRGGPASSSTVYCASDNMRRNYCSVGPSRRIQLVRKRSDAACDLNRSYGFDRNGIWVDRGCRADFEVFR